MGLSLYDFQIKGVAKLVKVLHGLNGDDMGLGKTPQAIMIDKNKRRLSGPAFAQKGKPLTLVVCPLSMVGTWAEEFKRWNPTLKVVVLNPKELGVFTYAAQKGRGDVFICHWQALRRMPDLKKIWWFHVIGDEIHKIKNRKAQLTIALKALHAENKLGLSGTAADNKPEDLWSVLNWLYPKVFNAFTPFYKKHVRFKYHNQGICMVEDCDGYHKRGYKEVTGCAEVEDLHRVMGPFYVRRLKEEVAKDLPEKYYSTRYVDLTDKQRRAYEGMRRELLAWVGKHEDEPLAAPIAIAKLTRLQQFACAYGEMEKYKKWVDEEDPITLEVKRVLKEFERLRLTEPSTKLDAVMDIFEDNPDEPIGVFAQSKQIIHMLRDRLIKEKIPVACLTGDVKKQEDRTRMIQDFQAGKYRAFVGTISAGGIGITLTAASTGVFIDRAWSPSWNRQAEDRFHRIGQTRPVHIIDIVARDTLDWQRNMQIERKWGWLKELLGDNHGVGR